LRDREFESNHEESDEHRNDLDYGNLDNNRDEESVLVSGLDSSRITHGTIDKVPEKLAVEKSPEACPYGINASRESDKPRIFVPHKISHWFEAVGGCR